MREPRPGEGAVIVPYCPDCHFHVSAASTRALAAGLSSSLVAFTLAAVVPLIVPVSVVAYAAFVLAGAALPVFLVLRVAARPRLGHTASGRAVWWTRDGALACSSAPWADELADRNGLEMEVRRSRAPASRLAWLGFGVALLGVLFFHPVHYPRVRVVNLTSEPLRVFCDGKPVAVVEPSSQESVGAGVELRLPAGMRHLTVQTRSGKIVDDRLPELSGRLTHLYAPGSAGHCFWLESETYGRQAGPEPSSLEPLDQRERFWTLPEPIDTWFSPNPAIAPDARSSGGRLVALRHARCAEAPAAVRETAGPNDSFASPAQ